VDRRDRLLRLMQLGGVTSARVAREAGVSLGYVRAMRLGTRRVTRPVLGAALRVACDVLREGAAVVGAVGGVWDEAEEEK